MTGFAVKTTPHLVPVSVDDQGRTLCPYCHEPMVEREPGVLQCPDAAIWSRLYADLVKAVESAVIANGFSSAAHRPRGILASLADLPVEPLWPLSSGLGMQEYGRMWCPDLREYRPWVDWRAAAHALGQVA